MNEWLLDVSFGVPAFVPYERDTDSVIIGLTMLSDKCPGKIIGVIHCDGQEAVESWVEAHPNWYSQYSSEEPGQEDE